MSMANIALVQLLVVFNFVAINNTHRQTSIGYGSGIRYIRLGVPHSGDAAGLNTKAAVLVMRTWTIAAWNELACIKQRSSAEPDSEPTVTCGLPP